MRAKFNVSVFLVEAIGAVFTCGNFMPNKNYFFYFKVRARVIGQKPTERLKVGLSS